MANISDETYEQLRQLLEGQNLKSYTRDDVKEIGDGFIDFLLALNEIEGQLNNLI